MKVAILSYYSGMVDRGVETWAVNLQKKLKPNIEISIISGSKLSLKSDNWFYHRGLILINVLESIPKWANSDVIIPTNGTFQTLICRIVSWIYRKPMIVFGHAGLGADDVWNLWCSPNIFVAFTEAQAEWAKKYKLPWTTITKINHAVDTKRFTPAVKKVTHNIVLSVAANIPHKRINLVELAVKQIPDAQFVAVGPGNPITVPFENMPEQYRQAKVFCLVTETWEAFGLVYLEALATNLPVIATDDPTRREIVGNGGILVAHPDNSDELVTALQQALKTDWKDLPRRQAEKFSWDKIAIQYQELFNRLCSQ
jgi:glycosyltransferase involved in cell wall biosynthesis